MEQDEDMEMLDDEAIGEKNGFFKVYHFGVLNALSDAELEEFGALRTDAERLAWVHARDYVHQMPSRMAEIMLANSFVKGKSADAAHGKRLDGNRAFQARDYVSAVDLYSEAVLKAPFVHQGSEEPELAMAYANRSACLVHLGDYSLALADIDLALENGYPVDLRYKLLERRAKCLQAIGRPFDEIASTCESALDAAKKSVKLDAPKRNQFERDVKKLIDEAKSSTYLPPSPKADQGKKAAVPDVSGGPSAQYPSISRKMRIEASPELGRYGVADKRIGVGDVLAVEKPFASVMNPLKYKTNCHHCYKVLARGSAVQPCPNCARVRFCSTGCRQQALGTYHGAECAVLDVLYAAGISITCYLALRMASLRRPSFFLGLKPAIDNPELHSDLDEDAKSYLHILNLVTHADKRNKESFFHITLMADFLLKCLKTGNYFGKGAERNFSDPLTDEEKWIGALLLRHMQVVQFNAHEIAELKMARHDAIGDAQAQFIGAALYPTLALLNHSCEPGIVRYCIGDTIVVRAIKTIAEGEPVNENYGPIYTRKAREQRRKALKERYWFDCCCQACEENWPKINELKNDALRFRCAVKTCRKPLLVPMDTMTPFITCSACKKSNNILTSLQKLQETEEPFSRGAELLQLGDYANALQCCSQTLGKLDEILCPPYRDYILCQENARRCMLAMGNLNVTG